ncbi:DNA integrity scanning protein DisA [Clostridium vincentii]|uniref:DNA integrity scanning protein DisA n=2 Tax=Clostridium vincentii TaxID=52704 RepID=A0A2T0BAK4_9CLOT|nr:DNA integrity scanning protein DisA [Clostridium vincentii]
MMRLEKDMEIQKILKVLCPGTALREGLENILRAKTGGLIVLSDSEEIMKMADGGFIINAEYTATYIYELAKMDGAIILSKDLKKIISANIQLLPESYIPTFETGTRHRTAHRVAKQTGNIVIAISQRRNMITVYKGDIKYVLRESSVILEKANQAIQALNKYVVVLEKVINNLNILEFQDSTTLFDVVTAAQRTEMVMRIVEEIKIYILELGNEGRLISMQLNELVRHIEKDGILLIRDYIQDGEEVNDVYKGVQKLSQSELLDLETISGAMGYGGTSLIETLISPKGYRLLSKVPRLPSTVIENVITQFKDLASIIEAEIEDLDKVEGIGETRARAIRSGLKRINEQVYLNKQL